MGKKRNKRRTRFTSKRFFILVIALILIIFLALPLIFQDPYEEDLEILAKQEKALPLKNENPFTHYLKLLKNFYTLGKGTNDKKQFTQVNNSLLAKNTADYYQEELPPTLSAQATVAASLNKEETADTQTGANYYAQETASNPLYNLIQEPQDPFVEQKPFDNILIEGLYEASHTDPYEVKQAARKTLFDIFSPRKRLSLLTHNLSSPSLFAKNDINGVYNYEQTNSTQQGTSSIRNFQHKEQTYDRIGVGNSYNYGSLNTFGSNVVLGDFDIKGLPFESQASLVSGRLNTIYQNSTYSKPHSNNDNPNRPNNQHHNNPVPPPPPANTFDPNKWETEIKASCSSPDSVTVQEQGQEQFAEAKQDTKTETKQDVKTEDKIPYCDTQLIDKLDLVDKTMQKDYKYIFVSGKYNDKIMIPEKNSLPDKVRDAMTSNEARLLGIDNIQLPPELSDEKNTEKTQFEFVRAIKPQLLDKLMRNEKTILVTVDEDFALQYQDKAILMQSGEIETYSGANRLIKEINNFPQKQIQIRQAMQKQEQEDKTQKTQDLKQKIEANI